MARPIKLEEVLELRKEIPLCSLFVNDYKNTFGIDAAVVCDFFDGYADYLGDLMKEDGIDDSDYFEHLGLYDNDVNLAQWFYSFDECPLLVEWEKGEWKYKWQNKKW